MPISTCLLFIYPLFFLSLYPQVCREIPDSVYSFKMRVLKFGGTSVGTVNSLLNVKKIVEAITEPHIVVVSALGGLTDKLIATADLAAKRLEWREEWQAMADRHHNIINAVVQPENIDNVLLTVDNLLNDLARNYEGVQLLGQLPQQTLDTIVSFGERMSAPIVAGMIQGAELHYSPDFIKTEKWFDKNIANVPLTESLIRKEFPHSPDTNAVTGGFIASDTASGAITNLGRGGSDYTAALIAATLDASVLDIWTDVDGFMTTDPRIVKSAQVIPEMSFVESMELCSFGAKVIYPPTIYPVFHKNIPIRILNTFNPEVPGTFISDAPTPAPGAVRGISAIKQMALISLAGQIAVNVPLVTSRAFNALARCGIPLFLVAQPQDGAFSFTIAAKDAQNAVNALNEEFAPDLLDGRLKNISIQDNLAVVALVGDNIRQAAGVGARVAHTLRRNGIDVLAASEGSSKTTVTVVINQDLVNKAMPLIHDLFF